jgi:hypothetical protein
VRNGYGNVGSGTTRTRRDRSPRRGPCRTGTVTESEQRVRDVYDAETLGNKLYVRRETLLFDICTVLFWYTQQLYFQHTLRLDISHGTDSIMAQYDAGRTKVPFWPFDVCTWASPFLVQDSPIEGTPHQCPSCGIFVTTYVTIKHVDWSWLASLREWGIE